MKEFYILLFMGSLTIFGLGYIFGFDKGVKIAPKRNYRPKKSVTVGDTKIELHEN